MQQEPQGSQPAPQVPPPTPTPPAPPAQSGQGDGFYQPQNPAPYTATPEHPTFPPAPGVPHAAVGGHPATLTWEASEYVHNDKGGMWLVGFGIIVAIFLGIAIWLQVWTFAILILVMAVAMGIFAFRQPRVLSYTLNDQGVQIGDKMFHYSDFRAFGILEDGAFFTMTFIPVRRFSPALNVYFAEEQGEDIIDIVSEHLPMEHIEPDIIDRVMRRLRF